MLVLQVLRRCLKNRRVMTKALRLLILIEGVSKDWKLSRDEQSKLTRAFWDLVKEARGDGEA